MMNIRISTDTAEKIATDVLLQWRLDLRNVGSTHPEDVAANNRRIAAIDVLLAYAGVVVMTDNSSEPLQACPDNAGGS